MDDLVELYEHTETYPENLRLQTEEWLVKLRSILWGSSAAQSSTKEDPKKLPAVSPQQTKKRVKRLTALNEEDSDAVVSQTTITDSHSQVLPIRGNVSPRHSRRSSADVMQSAEAIELSDTTTENDVIPKKKSFEEETADSSSQLKSEATNLMPPPPAPAPTLTVAASSEEVQTGRPQRAAKLKSEKCLKEPKLNVKIRRPTEENVQIKLEHEQRPSQMHEKKSTATREKLCKSSVSSTNDSVVIMPVKNTTPLEISSNSDEDDVVQPTADTTAKTGNSRDAIPETTEVRVRLLRLNIKSDKLSIEPQEEKQVPTNENTLKAPKDMPPSMAAAKLKDISFDDNSMASSLLSSTANTSTAAGKKTRKKKNGPPHKPIKVERFSDLEPKPSPIASRTRHGSTGKQTLQHEEKETNSMQELPVIEDGKRPGSVYEDAVETPPSRHSKTTVVNETVTLAAHAADATMNLGPVPVDATFCTNPGQTTFQVAPGQTTFVMDAVNPNATVSLNKNSDDLADATFDIHSSSNNAKEDDNAGQRSFETAKDTSVPHNDTPISEAESYEPSPPLTVKQKAPPPTKPPSNSTSAKKKGAAAKVPARTNELFNPLAQSPVKMRVEAFGNAAAVSATEQPKRPRNKKENVTPTSATTPVIGKLPVPSLGRFLTPTKSSNISTASSAFAKKLSTSASKAVPLIKSASSTLHRSNSNASVKTLQRENSADDFRKNLHNLAEERKRQREQKHLMAAQQREAKERERAERVAKLAKQKEEKRLQKQQEKLEQQKREMDEIQRKLRLQQEEEAKIKAAKEREMLMHMKQQQQQQQMSARQKMMPPPPKTTSKYTFEMLHEDDSTDDEDKVSYKRPPPPSWSRRHNRGPNVLKQEYTPSSYIDSFFSVQPMTPDLKQIFPNIEARHLKRNSSVLWSTPPRSATTTSFIGKLPGSSFARFFTPTQNSNVATPSSSFAKKKVPTSSSNAMPLTKSPFSALRREK